MFVDIVPEILEENKLYISKKYGVAIHLCLCGCKEKTVTPFNNEKHYKGDKYHWGLIEKEGKISLLGSIGNYNFPCKSHYIITNNIANFV